MTGSVKTEATKKPARTGYRKAQQPRSARTEAKFLKAADKLFAKHGYSGTRVGDIIRESGCSTGSFYHRFSDKEGLFRILLERHVADMMARAEAYDLAAVKDGSIWKMMFEFAEESLDSISSRIGFYKAVEELSLHDPTILNRLRQIMMFIGERSVQAVPRMQGQIGAEDPEKAIKQAVQLVVTLVWRTEMGDGVFYPADKKERCAMLADAACGILRAEIPKR